MTETIHCCHDICETVYCPHCGKRINDIDPLDELIRYLNQNIERYNKEGTDHQPRLFGDNGQAESPEQVSERCSGALRLRDKWKRRLGAIEELMSQTITGAK